MTALEAHLAAEVLAAQLLGECLDVEKGLLEPEHVKRHG